MTPERWQEIEELYHSARERGGEALANADPELRQEVERLLAEDSESGDKLLDQSAADLIADAPDAPVTPGTQLGPYRIEQLLGQGGMGQVYRAWDTRLDRPVAIKICRRAFLDRFKQESRSIAAISHPHVCTLHDIGPNYLVMELLEGETLAARLRRGKLTLAQTLRFGAQIAEALGVAHARGIVHRDLKPANIMITKTGVKVLDFGLARLPGDPTLTQPGKVIGTPAYMSPERSEGKEVDGRADIYALGLILVEMAAGRYSKFPKNLPPTLDRVIRRCLETDPDDRWQSARDLEWELKSIAETPAATLPGSQSRFPMWTLALASVAVIALAVFAVLRFGGHTAPPQMARMNVLLPEKSRALSLAVSPDGRFVAVVLVKDGKQQIWVRAFDSPDMTVLAGTDGAADPFWSPNSRVIAFFADSRLKKIDRSGGPVQIICNALGALGGTWNAKGLILIGGLANPQTVSDAGGTAADLPGHTFVERYPSFLPDGRHYVATRNTGIWLGSIDDAQERRILPDASKAQVMAASDGGTGALLFVRGGTLTALPFDMRQLQPTGDPYPVAEGLAAQSFSPPSLVSASGAGVLAWASGEGRDWQLVWRNREGKDLGSAGQGGSVVMISPDGKQVIGDHLGSGIWVLDLATGVTRRLDIGKGAMGPIWSPDGKYVAWRMATGIYRVPASGAGESQLLLKQDHLTVPESWSPDGRYILYAQVNPSTGSGDLFALPVDGNQQPLVLADSPANEGQGQFSPDGHWVAYTSNESGQSEIYVIPFPPAPNGGRWLVSRGGGVQPRWRRDGKELFYISPDWTMMAVPVSKTPVFQPGTPQPLFNTEMVDTGIRAGPFSWDIAPDGKRFLIITDKSQDTSSLNVILNWHPQQQK